MKTQIRAGVLAGLTMVSGCVSPTPPTSYYQVQPGPNEPTTVYAPQPPGVVPDNPIPIAPAAPPPPPPQQQPAPQPVAPPAQVVIQQPPPQQVVVQAPPPPQVEIIPPAPSVEVVWVPGFWSWNGRWMWMSGRWAYPPHRHAIWIGGAWVGERHGYRYHPGHWR